MTATTPGSAWVGAVGLHSLVGRTASASAAAIRARILRFTDHPYVIDREGAPLRVAAAYHLGDLQGPERLIALAAPALLEAWEPLTQGVLRAPALYLGLPEPRPGFSPADAQAVAAGLSRLAPFSEVAVLSSGHCAGTMAIAKAQQAVASGRADVCLAGGVDSNLHDDTLSWLDRRGQLSSSGSRSGFIPGEAAAFVLICSPTSARTLGLRAMLALGDLGLAHEPNHLKTRTVCLGDGLARAIGQAARTAPEQVFCDLNGERYRTEEWALAALRLPDILPDPSRYEAPARVLGDVGAATGAVCVAVMAHALSRGYGRARSFIVWNSSEGGQRAALSLTALTPPGAR